MIIISSVNPFWQIGNKETNDLIFKSKQDMAFFKKMTMGKICIMGRNTWESLPRPKIIGRLPFVVTSDTNREQKDGEFYFKSLYDALKANEKHHGLDVCIIGGNRIYRDALIQGCKTMYLTHNEARYVDDATFFPFEYIDWREWKSISATNIDNASIVKYERV